MSPFSGLVLICFTVLSYYETAFNDFPQPSGKKTGGQVLFGKGLDPAVLSENGHKRLIRLAFQQLPND